MLQHVAADLALAAAGVAGEERRAVHDDREPRAAVLRVLGVREQVQQEQELPVTDPRQAWAEPAGRTALVFGLDGVLVALPILAVGRIGDQIVERVAAVAIVPERAAEWLRRFAAKCGASSASFPKSYREVL